jgi:hypothetical protein
VKTTRSLLSLRRKSAAEARLGICGLWIAILLWGDPAVYSQEDPTPAAESPVAEPAVATPQVDETPITIKELQAHAGFLASDTLEGRDAGTPGGRATAAYLADELKRLKYLPIGTDSDYRQPFGTGYQNVLGLLEGSDPQLKKEWVVIGAHFDHVGYGNPLNSHGPFGLVHNGADDNASGVSCLLEIAEALRGAPAPKRSIAVAFWDAEERGLLGSAHWLANHPDLPQVEFYTNIDMVGRLRSDTAEVFGVRTLPGLRSMLTRSNVSDLQLKFSGVQRDDSDHYNFYQRNIPYVMVFSGLHYDYHRPSDDIEKLNFEGIQKIAEVLTRQMLEVANHSEPLLFRDICRSEHANVLASTPLPSRLGVTWSPARQKGQTITLTSIEADSSAEKAGLNVGDELVTINGVDVREIDNFIEWIRRSPVHLDVDVVRARDRAQEQVALDLKGIPLPDGLLAARDSAEPGIAIVTAVTNASLAAQWGFRQGDRIYSVNDSSKPESRSWQVERTGRLMQLPVAEADNP